MIRSGRMVHNGFDLSAAARQEMINEGFQPDFPPDAARQLAGPHDPAAPAPMPACETSARCCGLPSTTTPPAIWIRPKSPSASDGGIRVLIAIADVDADVQIGTPIDTHAAAETTSVYTGIRTFPMLPEQLSTDLTSLNEDADRPAVVVDMVVAPDGSITSAGIYRALVRNQAQLTYNGVGPWLEGTSPLRRKLPLPPISRRN